MIPLKTWIRRAALSAPLRYLAGPLYGAAMDVELRVLRALDERRRSPVPADVTDVTAIVKTFERPRELARLLESIRRLYPALLVVVADDSRVPCQLPGVELVRLPFDSGVSAGRQAALERVRTRYVWVLDDDFVLHAGSQLDLPLEALERNGELDLVGGAVIDLPFLRRRGGNAGGIFPTAADPRIPPGTRIDGVEVRDKVPNFFVGRTERVKLVGWTRELKRLDHADFFTRARGILVSAFCDGFSCLHAQTPFDRSYQRHRQAFDDDRLVLSARHGLGS